MADLVSLLQLLGAGSIGGVVAQYVSAAPERRKARAAAREAMYKLEQCRWSSGEPNEWPTLREAAHTFEAAALIAGVPREVSQWYVRTIVATYGESRRSWANYPDPEYGGGVRTTYLDAFAGATELVHYALWHPQRVKLLWRWRLRASKAKISEATADSPLIQRDLTTRSGSV